MKVFFVIGEDSGDQLGAQLMDALKANQADQVTFSGLAGPAMIERGMTSLFPIEDIAVMGLGPVIRRLPTILRRMKETTKAALDANPDVVVIIDSPDFTHRVARAIKKQRPDLPIVGWISPSVWAWRPGRAQQMAGYLDHLLAILPFEPDVHRELGGPPCTYIGHPLLNRFPARSTPNNLDEQEPPTLLLMAGSRSSELDRHLSLIRQTVDELMQLGMSPKLVLPTLQRHEERLRREITSWAVKPEIIVDADAKAEAMGNAHAALAVSGTVTLELALNSVPTVVFYRLDALASLFRGLIKVWSVVLPNLILQRPVMREYINDLARPNAMARALKALLEDTPERRAQLESLQELRDRMAVKTDTGRPVSSADLAAGIVMKVAK